MSVSLYQARLRAVRLRTAETAGALFEALPDYDAEHAEPFARAVAPVVAGGQLVAARTTNAYVTRAVGVRPVPMDSSIVTGPAARPGVDPLDEYQRPFGVIWGALGDDVPYDEAVARGRRRLDVLVLADVWLASRVAMVAAQRAVDRINGWVRVADAGACDLCASADGWATSAAADLAFHPGCGCTADPVVEPPADTAPPDPDVVDVDDHGELGPVLVDAKPAA